ncbi:hypothetical protein [Erwinia sp. Leaf53]|uniref:hypothetical protein n=1 Tax=Erwinia sp. Leaf53 TaxID=1736225 RepID=UPI0006F4870D|nr:hypothetical protein [Erwinia sp. Leaf53]
MKLIGYTVLVTFDLSYANSSDYRYVNSYLSDNGFEQLSHKNHKLPSNTYLGTETEKVGAYESVAIGAERVKNRVYRAIKNAMNGGGLNSVVFVMVSPEAETFYSCSRPIDF